MIYDEYKNNLFYSFGNDLVVNAYSNKIEGKYKNIDNEGRLILSTDFGDKIINVGDIFYNNNNF